MLFNLSRSLGQWVNSLVRERGKVRSRRNRWTEQIAAMESRVVLSSGVLPGDLVVVAYNSSEDVPVDSIALMALADIPDGETVFLTDRGWQFSTSSLRPTSLLENTVTWVTSGVTAGKIIRINTGTPNATTIGVSDVVASFQGTSYGTLSGSLDPDLTSGDQLLIYQTADNNKDSTAVFVSAFNADAPSLFNVLNDDSPLDGWSDSDTSNLNNTSKLPPGLTAVTTSGGAGNAFGIGTYVNSGSDEFDNYIYNGPTSPATRATWVSRINTFANWLGRNTTTYDLTPTPGLPGALDNLDTLPFPSPPTATIVVSDTSLIAGETSLVTFTFSEAVSGFTNADVSVANGTLSAVSSGDGGITWTATLTPTSNLTDSTNVVTVDLTGVSGILPGVGTATSNNYAIDTQRPTATIVVADTSLIAGETSAVTITFSEAVTGFTNADLTVANGTLSAVSSGDGGVTWTATLTPSSNLTDSTNVITLANTGVSDGAGNAGTGTTNSNNYAIDTQRPTATIVVADTSLIVGETSLVTITFSEAVTGFTNADLSVANGTLSAVSSGDGGVTWTATLTPSSNLTDSTNVITLANTGVSDGSGNAGTGTTDSNNYAIDTQRPTATIVVADSDLTVGETSLVTITFSEAVTGFTNADLTIPNGTLSAVSSGDGGVTWTATFTPTASVNDATNVITLANTGVTDGAGNAGTGTTDSNNFTIDTVVATAPTATIVVSDTSLIAGETSLVTITFSEAVTGFTNADLSVANGTLSAVSSGDGGITWTATLTPSANTTDATNVITLDLTGVTGTIAGVGTQDSNNYVIDTQRPTATIVVADSVLTVSETSLVTITFSEAVTGFANVDLLVPNGTLTAVSSGDGGITWTATFTPTSNVNDATNVITLDNTGVADASGNAGTGTTDSNNYAIDTQSPTATFGVSDTLLKIGDTSLITITFSEAVTGFDNSDLTFQNGTLSPVSSSDGGVTWTATFTPSASVTDISNDFTLDNTGVTDAAGNAGTGTTSSLNYVVDTVRPTATIVVADSDLTAGETSLVTITFSEMVSGFANDDLTILNGTLSAVSSGDGGVTWTATFTPAVAVNDATNVITLDNTGVTDTAGNAGTGTTDSNNYAVNTGNRAPVFTGPLQFSVEEFSARWTFIGRVAANDPDGLGVTFSVVGGNPDATLFVGSDGRILVDKSDLTGLRHRGSFNLVIRATDTSPEALTTDATVQIFITPALGTRINPSVDGAVDASNTVDASGTGMLVQGGATPSRGVLEFDLSALPTNRPLKNAFLYFSTSSLVGGATVNVPIDVFGYAGNGAVDAADASAGIKIGTRPITNAGGSNQLKVHTAQLDAEFVRNLIGTGQLGLVLRNDVTSDGVIINTLESSASPGGKPYLVLQFGDDQDTVVVRDVGASGNGHEFVTLTSNGTSFTTNTANVFAAGAWEQFVTGDFDGNGHDDIAGRLTSDGSWWVSLANGSGVHQSATQWGAWSAATTWSRPLVADFDGDGSADIAGRDANGDWWVNRSTGTAFDLRQWGNWTTGTTWSDVLTGDFNRDGRADIAGRNSSGQWFVARSTGTTPANAAFVSSQWGLWSTATVWSDVQVGDFNGDGRDDIAGRSTIGQWWVNRSNGVTFGAAAHYGNWSTATVWRDVRVGDFNGDGLDDIIGRSAIGQWWVAETRTNGFTVKHLGNWTGPQTKWSEVSVGDFNHDGRADLVGRNNLTDEVWTSLWSPTGFVTTLWSTLPDAATREWRLLSVI